MGSEMGALGWTVTHQPDPVQSREYQNLRQFTAKKDEQLKVLKRRFEQDEEELKFAYTPERRAFVDIGHDAADLFKACLQSEEAEKPSQLMQDVFKATLAKLKEKDERSKDTDSFAIMEKKSEAGARTQSFNYVVFKYKDEKDKDQVYALTLGDPEYTLLMNEWLKAKLSPKAASAA